MVTSVARRPLLAGALGLPLLAHAGAVRAQGIEAAEAPRRAERWRDLKAAIFDGRETEPAGDALALVAPPRALDAAAVPVSVSLSAEAAPRARAIHLIIDENPAPVAAVFRAGPAGDLRALSTRVRVDAYTLMHAVAELDDGRLLETAQFVKAAGGCSAPVGTDLRAARERMGRMRLVMPEGPPMGPDRAVPVQVALSHPNLSGLQIDQLSRLSIPAEFVRTLRVLYRGAEVLTVEADISIAENPTFGFALAGEAGGELRVEAEDSRERRFATAWTIGNSG